MVCMTRRLTYECGGTSYQIKKFRITIKLWLSVTRWPSGSHRLNYSQFWYGGCRRRNNQYYRDWCRYLQWVSDLVRVQFWPFLISKSSPTVIALLCCSWIGQCSCRLINSMYLWEQSQDDINQCVIKAIKTELTEVLAVAQLLRGF